MNKFRYSRRGKNRFIFLITSVFLVIIIFMSSNNKNFLSVGENFIGSISNPVTDVFYKSYQGVKDIFFKIFNSKSHREEFEALKDENLKLKEELSKAEDVIADKEYLKKEFDALKNSKHKLKRAEISGKDPGNIFLRFTINKGSIDNVKNKDVIIAGSIKNDEEYFEAVVGKVTEVGLNWARVISIVDENENKRISYS